MISQRPYRYRQNGSLSHSVCAKTSNNSNASKKKKQYNGCCLSIIIYEAARWQATPACTARPCWVVDEFVPPPDELRPRLSRASSHWRVSGYGPDFLDSRREPRASLESRARRSAWHVVPSGFSGRVALQPEPVAIHCHAMICAFFRLHAHA